MGNSVDIFLKRRQLFQFVVWIHEIMARGPVAVKFNLASFTFPSYSHLLCVLLM